MASVRAPAVAGMFYPDDPGALGDAVRRYLNQASGVGPAPKALIAPHAGYIYSGPVAASAYARLGQAKARIERVVLLGPSHYLPFRGLAVADVEAFATPLGNVPLDREKIDEILTLPQVHVLDEAHSREHSLEVHLPFLQKLLDDFTLVPLAVGQASADEVAEVLEALWGGPETLIVISSDLSHYHDYDTARRLDAATSEAIVTLNIERIGSEQACGCVPIHGLLEVARRQGLEAETIDLRNSGDTAGPRDKVVGYGAYLFS